MSLVDLAENGFMFLDFKDNCPVMLISELSDLDLGPVVPVVLSVLLGVGVEEVDWFEFTLVLGVAKGDNEVEVALDQIVLNVNLHESRFVGVAAATAVLVLVFVLGLVVMVILAHFFKRLYLLRKDSKIYIESESSRALSSFMVSTKRKIK